jgi:hypothetical protein
MTTTEAGPVEREEQLAVLRKRMARAARRGHMDRYEELRQEHDRLKARHVELSHEEQRAAARVRAVARRAQERPLPSGRWRLPPGFGVSPLAAQRARAGWRPRVEPSVPAGGLRPWRRGPSMSERIYRP